MKIKSLHIYGYGQFINFTLDQLSNLQVIYGENEAGKSTIMAFIHGVLFGFPTRKQAELRYEPKFHSAYGGKLVVLTKEHGEVTIERVKGKSSGDVSVMFEDGTIGGEELLEKLLSGMNKWMYQSIFSFNLEGLQGVQHLKGDEIGRYLLAAGSIGTDQLLSIEESIKKEAEELYKPYGKKPKLNEYLRVLREQEKDLKKAKQQNNEYGSLVNKRDLTLIEIEDYENKINQQKRDLTYINDLIKKWPIIKEYEQIESQLKELGNIAFPTDGLTRYDHYYDKVTALTSRKKTIEARISETNVQINDIELDDSYYKNREKAEKLIQEWPIFLQLVNEIDETDRKLQDWEDRKKQITQALHLPVEQSLLRPNIGFDIKGRIRECTKQKHSIEAKLEEVEIQITTVESEIEDAEKQCSNIESNLIPEEEYQKLQQRVSKNELLKEKEFLTKSLEFEKRKLNQKKGLQFLHGCFAIVTMIVLGWSLLDYNWPVVTIMSLLFVYLLVIFFMNKRDNSNYESMEERLKLLNEELMNGNEDQTSLVEQQTRLRNDWKQHYRLLQQGEQRKEELLNQRRKWLQLFEENEQKLNSIKKELSLDITFDSNRLEDAFILLTEYTQLNNEIKKESKKLEIKKEKRDHIRTEWSELAKYFTIQARDLQEIYFAVKMFLNELAKREQQIKELKIKKNEWVNDLQLLNGEIKEYQSILDKLLELAGVTNEEDFRWKAKRYEKVVELKTRKDLLSSQIDLQVLDRANNYASLEDVQKKGSELQERIKQAENTLSELQHELAAINYNISVLEEGGTYTEKLHRFHHMQFLFNEEAKNWAKLVIANTIIQKTMEKFIQDRFPRVVMKAQQFLAFLTDGKYTKIKFYEDGNFRVEQADGILYEPIELSQGTKELIYTVFRFALIVCLRDEYPYPVIIDDGFVNFDYKRTKKVIELIKKISNDSQILFFSCHEHVRNLFNEENILTLSNEAHEVY